MAARSSGPFTGKQDWRCGLLRQLASGTGVRAHADPSEGCWHILTAGSWPWKSASIKECVTTHLPNKLASKMDDARSELSIPNLHALKKTTISVG